MKNKNNIYTIEELVNMKKAFDERTENIKAEITANQEKISKLLEDMDKATDAGDMQKYKELYAQSNDLEAEIAANSSILERVMKNNLRGFSDDDVKSAWNNYIDKYNIGYQKMIGELNNMKKQIADQYMKIARAQSEALQTKDTACRLLSTFSTGNIHASLNKLTGIEPAPERTFNVSDYYSYAESKFIEYCCDLMASDMTYDRCMEVFGNKQ